MRRSEYWKYFNRKNDKEAVCKICLKCIRTCGNTSNLCKHLKTHDECHRKKLKNKNALKTELSGSMSDSALPELDDFDVSNEDTTLIPKRLELLIPTPVNRRFVYIEDGTQYNIQHLLYFICVDKLPFDVVTGRGFINLMKQICPSFKIPGVDLLKRGLTEFYNIKKIEAAHQLKKVQHCSLTCHVWTETMSTSYLSITVHYLEGIALRSRSLGTVELDDPYTCDTISDILEKRCLEFNIEKEKLSCIVTDNGDDITAAITKFAGISKHLSCFAHSINLIIQSVIDIKSVGLLCSKVRAVVKFIRGSETQRDILRSKQSGTPLKLILDVKTRSNSSIYMLTRYCELATIVHQMLLFCSRAPPLPTPFDLEEIRLLLDFLKPFEFVTKEMCDSRFVSASKIIPIANLLKTQIQNMYVSPGNNMLNLVKETIIAQLETHYCDMEINPLLAAATLLDPRFKEMPFANTKSLEAAKYYIRQMTMNSNMILDSDLDTSSSESGIQYDFWKDYKTLTWSNQIITSSDADELTSYVKAPVTALHSDPNLYWEDMKTIFPCLYSLAREYLHIPATSVSSELLFSKAGAVLSKTRNRLPGKTIDQLLFLSDCNDKEWEL